MWGDIIISIFTSIGEAVFSNRLEHYKKKKFDKKLEEIIAEQLTVFSDTSLDCTEFFNLINNYVFTEMLRNYFFAINESETKSECISGFEKFICKSCTSAKRIEVNEFIKAIERIYFNFLQKTIEENYELNAFYQLIKISHRELLDRILTSEDELKRYINCLVNPQVDITDENIVEYHKNCKKDFGIIRFTGISGAESKQTQNINDFYIENNFSYCGNIISSFYRRDNHKDTIKYIKLNELFDYSNKIVLLGSAGLGKSTSLNYLFCNYEDLFNQNSIKIKIDLKEYAKSIVEDKYSVLWCLSKEFSKRIPRRKLAFDEIENTLDNYLTNGRCLVILDALDEIPSQSVRNKVRDEIANFCQVYYLNRFIISSRESGYLRNQFDNSFIHIKINEFDDDQIKKYTRNWIKVNNANADYDSFTKNFFAEVKRAKCRSIIRNPIILVLSLIIFDISNNLPNRRVDFYKKCIDTFLEIREDRKAMLPDDKDFKNILGDNMVVPIIAHYKFLKQENDIKYIFSEEELKKSILKAIEVSDTRIWIHPADLFAKYLVNRTELIREVDEGKFDFTHKTFYEYFLAVYFAKEMDTDEIIELLEKWIGDSNYNELAVLIIEVIIENNEVKRHKCIIDYLFDTIEKNYNSIISDDHEKAIEYFIIVANLYNNNMLQPRFHRRYYNLLLFKSKLVYDVERNNRINDSSSKINYNSNQMADLFHEYFTQDSQNIIKLMDCFYYLSKETVSLICKPNIVLLNSIKDMSYITCYNHKFQNHVGITKKSFINADSALTYIVNNYKELITASPLIYLNVLYILISKSDFRHLDLLNEYSFSHNNYFSSLVPPHILLEMAYHLFDSSDTYLVFLIATIICTNYKTDQFLYFILKNFDRKKHSHFDKYESAEKREKAINNIIELWMILNSNYTISKRKLIDKGLNCLLDNNFYLKLINCYKENKSNSDYYYMIKMKNYIDSINS